MAEHNERGEDQYHGSGGPLNVKDQTSPSPLGQAFLDAGMQIQLPSTSDFNGAQQEGLSPYQVTQKNGERWSAAKAYLTPNLNRPNLTVITHAVAAKIILEGKKAVGISYLHKGEQKEVRATREVILCGGTFNTPQLLLLSGIGPDNEIKKVGLKVQHELAGVGRNLQDHIDYVTSYKTRSRDAIGISPMGSIDLLKGIFEWRNKRTGMLTTPFAEAGAFLKSLPDLDIPDIQLHFVVGIVDDHNRKMHLGHGFSCHACVLRPKARGYVGLTSSDPTADPLIDPRFLSESEDLETLVRAFKIMRNIFEASAFDSYRGKELYTQNVHSDDDIRDAIRARADTVYHPVGSCKMGNDPMAVVDSRLRVHGIKGLRIADASIMPTLIGGNTNAPTIMIGEKAAHMIKASASESAAA